MPRRAGASFVFSSFTLNAPATKALRFELRSAQRSKMRCSTALAVSKVFAALPAAPGLHCVHNLGQSPRQYNNTPTLYYYCRGQRTWHHQVKLGAVGHCGVEERPLLDTRIATLHLPRRGANTKGPRGANTKTHKVWGVCHRVRPPTTTARPPTTLRFGGPACGS